MTPAQRLHHVQDELVASALSMDQARLRLNRVIDDVERLELELDVMEHED